MCLSWGLPQAPGTGEKPQREPALLSVEGRSWPVTVHYLEARPSRLCRPPTLRTFCRPVHHTVAHTAAAPDAACPPRARPQEPTADYVRAAVEACLEIHSTEGPGDVLVFLTGEEARR